MLYRDRVEVCLMLALIFIFCCVAVAVHLRGVVLSHSHSWTLRVSVLYDGSTWIFCWCERLCRLTQPRCIIRDRCVSCRGQGRWQRLCLALLASGFISWPYCDTLIPSGDEPLFLLNPHFCVMMKHSTLLHKHMFNNEEKKSL